IDLAPPGAAETTAVRDLGSWPAAALHHGTGELTTASSRASAAGAQRRLAQPSRTARGDEPMAGVPSGSGAQAVDKGVSSQAGLSWSPGGGTLATGRAASSAGPPPRAAGGLPLCTSPELAARAHTIALNPRLRP